MDFELIRNSLITKLVNHKVLQVCSTNRSIGLKGSVFDRRALGFLFVYQVKDGQMAVGGVSLHSRYQLQAFLVV